MALRVLLADDSMTAQNMGRKILADAGFDVTAVSNGATAVKKFAEVHPDILILDIYMPGYNGLEVCERVRATDKTLPVLLTVGKLEPYSQEDGDRVQASGVIVKPFEATDLINTVRRLVAKHEAEPAPAEPVAGPQPQGEVSADDFAFLLKGQPAEPAPVAAGATVNYYAQPEPSASAPEAPQVASAAPQPDVQVRDVSELPPLTDDDFAMLSTGAEAAPTTATPESVPQAHESAPAAAAATSAPETAELPVFDLGPAAETPMPSLADRAAPAQGIPLSWGNEPASLAEHAPEAEPTESSPLGPLQDFELPAMPMPPAAEAHALHAAAETAASMDPLLDLPPQIEVPQETLQTATEPPLTTPSSPEQPALAPGEVFELNLSEAPVTPEPVQAAPEPEPAIPLVDPALQQISEALPTPVSGHEPLEFGAIPAEQFERVEVPSIVAPDPSLTPGHEYIAPTPEILEKVRAAEVIIPEQVPSGDVTLEPLENNGESTPEFLEPLELGEPAAAAAPVETAGVPLNIDSTVVANIVNAVFERYKAQIISDIVRELAERQR